MSKRPNLSLTKLVKCRPSDADRWYECPVSAFAAKLKPWEPSIYAATGTAVMSELEKAIDDFDFCVDDFDKLVGTTVEVDGFKIKYTQDDIDAAKECFDYISSREQDGGIIRVEEEVETEIPTGDEHIKIKGRIDFRLIFDDMYEIIDYKHGVGVTVSANFNCQMLCYLKMVIDEHGPKDKYHLKIIQPRAREFAETDWYLTHSEFEGVWGHLEAGIHRVRATVTDVRLTGHIPMDDYKTGSHCKWCAIEKCCPARTNALLSNLGMRAVGESVKSDPQAVSAILKSNEIAKSHLKGVEKEAVEVIKRGDTVDGFKLVKSSGKRSVRKDLTVDEINELESVSLLSYEPKVAAMSEFDKAHKAKLIDINKYVGRTNGSIKLVPIGAKGEPLSFVDAFDVEESEETK